MLINYAPQDYFFTFVVDVDVDMVVDVRVKKSFDLANLTLNIWNRMMDHHCCVFSPSD